MSQCHASNTTIITSTIKMCRFVLKGAFFDTGSRILRLITIYTISSNNSIVYMRGKDSVMHQRSGMAGGHMPAHVDWKVPVGLPSNGFDAEIPAVVCI